MGIYKSNKNRGEWMLEELQAILSNLYVQYGLTDDTLRLSQLIDRLIYQEIK